MKYVGVTIGDATGHEAAVESFVRTYCICERPDVPHNIAYKSKGANVYSNAFLALSTAQMNSLVGGLSFTATPIGYESPNILVASCVNFMVEFPYKGTTKRLMPTEFFTGPATDLDMDAIRILEKRGCLRVYSG